MNQKALVVIDIRNDTAFADKGTIYEKENRKRRMINEDFCYKRAGEVGCILSKQRHTR